MWMALDAGLLDNDEKSSFFFLRPKWPKLILYFWLKCLKKTCPSDAGHTYIADIREHLPYLRAESKWSITSKYISKRVDCNNWYMCRQLKFIGPFSFTIGSVLNLTWLKTPGSDHWADQFGAKRRVSTHPSHPQDFSCTRYQNPSLSQTLNTFPETKHHFSLRNSFLLFLLHLLMWIKLNFYTFKRDRVPVIVLSTFFPLFLIQCI